MIIISIGSAAFILAETFKQFGETLLDEFPVISSRSGWLKVAEEWEPIPYIDRSLVRDTRITSQVMLNKPRFTIRKII